MITRQYVKNVRILIKEGSAEQYLSAVKNWSTPDRMYAHYLAKKVNGATSLSDYGRVKKLIAARPYMIDHLGSVHEFLEELSQKISVSDAVSGPVVAQGICIKNTING